MIDLTTRKVRCSDTLDFLMCHNEGLVFVTLTTKDVCTLIEIRQRWRNLRHHLVRKYQKYLPDGSKDTVNGFHYVMNYEKHPGGHGWHIHAVFNRYIKLWGNSLEKDIQRFGFGRVNIKKVYSKGVSDYLTKHALKAFRGVRDKDLSGVRFRLVNTSRGLPTLDSYSWHSEFNQQRADVMRSLADPVIVRSKSLDYLSPLKKPVHIDSPFSGRAGFFYLDPTTKKIHSGLDKLPFRQKMQLATLAVLHDTTVQEVLRWLSSDYVKLSHNIVQFPLAL